MCNAKLTQAVTHVILFSVRATLNISLPEAMKAWVDTQVAHGGYGTTSEYFRQLVREDQQRQFRDEVDAKLLAALDNGEPVEINAEWREERRRELARRIEKRKPKS